jgi:putative SOS response-associated peptidase YedK
MSRLFAIARTIEEIVAQFRIDVSNVGDIPSETIEGAPGLIVIEKDGLRRVKSVPWGFPRQTSEMRHQGEIPSRICLVADLTNPLWNKIVIDPRYRCLIPLTHFGEPHCPKGEKTRAWVSMRQQPLMAWAGFCKNTPEFGPVFAGMTMTANEKVRPYNDRMPALLKPGEFERWLHGSIQDVIEFQFREPPPSEDFEILNTRDRWRSGIPPGKAWATRSSMLI